MRRITGSFPTSEPTSARPVLPLSIVREPPGSLSVHCGEMGTECCLPSGLNPRWNRLTGAAVSASTRPFRRLTARPPQDTRATGGLICDSLGGGEGIRTPDLCRAKAALYRAELHPPGTPSVAKASVATEQRNGPTGLLVVGVRARRARARCPAAWRRSRGRRGSSLSAIVRRRSTGAGSS